MAPTNHSPFSTRRRKRRFKKMADGLDVDAKEFTKFYKQISATDAEVRKQLRKRLIEAAKPVVEEVKQAALAAPSNAGAVQVTRKKKGQQLGLRAGIANSTKADLTATGRGAGVHIRVSRSKFETQTGKPGTLVYLFEGRRKRPWRHPIFAEKGAAHGTWQGSWADQKPSPFLGVTVEKHKQKFGKELSKVVTDAIKQAGIDLR